MKCIFARICLSALYHLLPICNRALGRVRCPEHGNLSAFDSFADSIRGDYLRKVRTGNVLSRKTAWIHTGIAVLCCKSDYRFQSQTQAHHR